MVTPLSRKYHTDRDRLSIKSSLYIDYLIKEYGQKQAIRIWNSRGKFWGGTSEARKESNRRSAQADKSRPKERVRTSRGLFQKSRVSMDSPAWDRDNPRPGRTPDDWL